MIKNNVYKKISQNLLLKKQEFEFYFIDEIGFSNSNIALKSELYNKDIENDGKYISVFKTIFLQNYYTQNRLLQIWIIKENKPVGLLIAIKYDNEIITDINTNLTSHILGNIHLYIKPEFRNLGLAKEAFVLLEEKLMEKTDYPPSIILEDNAYVFSKYLQHCLALPYAHYSDNYNNNSKYLLSEFKKIFCNAKKLSSLKIDYPCLWDNYTNKNTLFKRFLLTYFPIKNKKPIIKSNIYKI